jgi:hypothetical protein
MIKKNVILSAAILSFSIGIANAQDAKSPINVSISCNGTPLTIGMDKDAVLKACGDSGFVENKQKKRYLKTEIEYKTMVGQDKHALDVEFVNGKLSDIDASVDTRFVKRFYSADTK